MNIKNISEKTSFDGAINSIADASRNLYDNSFKGAEKSVHSFLARLGRTAKACDYILKKGACALALAAMIACGGSVSMQPAAASAAQYVLSPQQQQSLFARIESMDISELGQKITCTEFERYAAFKALQDPKLRLYLDSHGIPRLDEIVNAAQRHGVSGKLDEKKFFALAIAVHEDFKSLIFSSMDEKNRAEAIHASSFDYYEDYEKDVIKRREAGELNEFQNPLPKSTVQVFLKYGHKKGPNAGSKNKLTKKDIESMWGFINGHIKKVYENPDKAACSMAEEIDCTADGVCRLKKKDQPWLNTH